MASLKDQGQSTYIPKKYRQPQNLKQSVSHTIDWESGIQPWTLHFAGCTLVYVLVGPIVISVVDQHRSQTSPSIQL